MNKDLKNARKQLIRERDQYLEQLRRQRDELSSGINHYRENISDRLEQSKEVVEWSKVGAAAIGGAFVVYKLVEWILLQPEDHEPVKETEAPTVTARRENPIVAAIKSQIASFLLAIAKKELEYLLSQWRQGK